MRVPDKPEIFDPVRFLALLFSENNPLRPAAATLVSELSLGWERNDTTISSETKSLTITPKMFEGEAKEMELVKTIFSACGAYVRSIFVADVSGVVARSCVEQFTSYVFEYCRNI